MKFQKRLYSKLRKLRLKKWVRFDTMILPSQGMFYDYDFKIFIKHCSKDDIIYYENEYSTGNKDIIELIKEIVKRNIKFNKHNFEYISSIDIMFLFFYIVKRTTMDKLWIKIPGEAISFESKNFYYFNPNEVLEKYDYDKRGFYFDDINMIFKLPKLSMQYSLTNFLENEDNVNKYNDYNVNFIYFYHPCKILSPKEIENLLIIFNDEMETKKISEMERIATYLKGFSNYCLYTKDGDTVKIETINLEKIFKT